MIASATADQYRTRARDAARRRRRRQRARDLHPAAGHQRRGRRGGHQTRDDVAAGQTRAGHFHVGPAGRPDARPDSLFQLSGSGGRARSPARATYGEWRRQPEAAPATFDDVDRDGARAIVDRVLQSGGGWLTPDDAQALLSAVGIPGRGQSHRRRARTRAVEAADRIGYPVVLKAIGPDDSPQDRGRRRAAAAADAAMTCARRGAT